MATILKHAKRASLASNRRSVARTRFRIALSMQQDALPGDEALKVFAAQVQRYRPHAAEVTQALSVLQVHHTA